MELNESLLDEIRKAFRKIKYGKITFIVSPDRDTLQCLVEESIRIPVSEKNYDKNYEKRKKQPKAPLTLPPTNWPEAENLPTRTGPKPTTRCTFTPGKNSRD